MNKVSRLSLVLVVAATVAAAVVVKSSLAQRITIGGSGLSVQDDEDDDQEQNRGKRGGNRSSQSGSSNQQKLEQLLQGGQNQSRRQGSFQQQQLQQQLLQQQQFQQQQLQNLQQQGQGGVTIGTWQGGKWQGSHKVDHWVKTFGAQKKPFSNQWYHDHPKAWKHSSNNSHVWVVGTLPGVYGWLGWGNVPQQYNVYHGGPQHVDYSLFGEWYPLGVFSLMAGPGDVGTRIVQLAVDRHGNIAGNYYDMITNSNYSVSGDVKRKSQRVYWSLNKNQFIRFRAHISQLLQPYGTVSVMLPGGQQQWHFVRLEN